MAQRAGRLAELRDLWRAEAARRDIFVGDGQGNHLVGTAGGDEFLGRAGADTLFGQGGADRIAGGSGGDSIRGGDGNDTLYGRADWDTLVGGAGDDFVDGGAGRDRLAGAGGADTLRGGTGHDILIGSADGERDVFVFGTDDGHDRIRGFEAWTDVVQLTGAGSSIVSRDANSGTATIEYGGTVLRIGDVFDTPLLIDVAGVDDVPVVEPLDAGEITEDDGTIRIDPLARQRDPEGDQLVVPYVDFTLLDATGAEIPPGDPLYVDLHGSVLGTLLWFDAERFARLGQGTDVTVRADYIVSDRGDLSGREVWNTLIFDVLGRNSAPGAADHAFDLVEHGEPVAFDIVALVSDADCGAVLSYALVYGTIDPAFVSLAGSVLTIDPAAYADNLAGGETVMVPVEFVVTDEHGASDTATLSLTLTGVNDAPHPASDTVMATTAGPVVGNLLANDTDPDGNLLRVVRINGLELDGPVEITRGWVDIEADGSFTFTPNGMSGATTFAYTISDGRENATAIVTIIVTEAVDPMGAAVDAADGVAAFDPSTVWVTPQSDPTFDPGTRVPLDIEFA